MSYLDLTQSKDLSRPDFLTNLPKTNAQLPSCPVAQSIFTHYSCFENMGQFVKKIQNMGCKKPGAKNRVIVIQKEKRQPGLAPSDLQPHYNNGVFDNVYLLALDNTKR